MPAKGKRERRHGCLLLLVLVLALAFNVHSFKPNSAIPRWQQEQQKRSFFVPIIASKEEGDTWRRTRSKGEYVAIFGLRRAVAKVKSIRRNHATRTPHDEIIRRDYMSSIPQAERYSSEDWLHNIASLKGSQVLQRISGPIIVNMIWAFVVSIVFKHFRLPALPGKVHTLLGSSLGLLLVFRTNASYARYWEGRSLWERLHNKARDLARSLIIYEDCVGTQRVTALARLMCAFPLILMEHLTGCTHKVELLRLVGPSVTENMECFGIKPLWACNRMAAIIRDIPESKNFSSRERLMFLGLVNDLNGVTGSCERLVQTPVPLSYARHTSRFLTLYLWFLPMVLIADYQGFFLSLVTGFTTWCLFGILEIGLLIEDPFAKTLKSTWTSVIIDSIVKDVLATIRSPREPLDFESNLFQPL